MSQAMPPASQKDEPAAAEAEEVDFGSKRKVKTKGSKAIKAEEGEAEPEKKEEAEAAQPVLAGASWWCHSCHSPPWGCWHCRLLASLPTQYELLSRAATN